MSFYDSSSSLPPRPFPPLSPNSASQLRLLLPTVRNPRTLPLNVPTLPSPAASHKSPKIKSSSSRSSRTRHSSLRHPPDALPMTVGQVWLGKNVNFEVVHDQLQLEGFQLFAVEKWVTERTRPIITLTVYTGDPRHKITVTALSPAHTLGPEEARTEWDKVIRELRQAGARPRDTEYGTLMVTSLANFRSDYTIVLIPSGSFLEDRDQLYTNINILRMGCSGRMALTLEEPRDTTKDRFISMYRMNDKIRSSELFGTTILELIKIIQAALSLFGMFSFNQDEWNGLLCDLTVDGIQRWVNEIGERHMGVEPTERVADPVVVCALFSQVSNTRNKLYALGFGHLIPKDPFLDPQGFLRAVSAFQDSRLFTSSSPTAQLLTDDVLNAIETAHSKSRTTEPYKVHRVLLNKLDDLTTDLRTSSGLTNINPTDIDQFVSFTQTKAVKDGVPSLKYLWSGRADVLIIKRKDRPWSDGEDDNGREREGKEKTEKTEKTEELSAGDEAWSGRSRRVQRKIESWAGLSRQMRRSIDAGLKGHRSPPINDSLSWSRDNPSVPEVVVTREGEEDEILSSRQTSPIPPSQRNYLGITSSIADTSTSNLSSYEQRVSEFNKIWPERPPAGFRVVTWSDPRSARSHEIAEPGPQRRGRSKHHVRDGTVQESTYCVPGGEIRGKKGTYTNATISRRRSFDDASRLARSRVLPVQRMKIDVELCGQLLVMRRREQHLESVVACLGILTSRLSQMNAYLREDYEAHQPDLTSAESRVKIIAEIEAARDKAYTMLQDTQALSYEAAQFDVAGLWNGVAPQRQKVFEMRSRVFDTGRRTPGAGRFNRVLWTLDGQETHVDWAGRTEEEVIEEHGLHDTQPLEEEEEEGEEHEREAVPKPPPSWLLKMISSWGNRWGAGRKKTDDTATKPPPIVDGDRSTLSSPLESGAISPVLKSPTQNLGESIVHTRQ